MSEISRFGGEWRGLSNFVSGPVCYQGVTYPTVEVAYQAAKIPDELGDLRVPYQSMNSFQAKKAARTAPVRPDWNELKLDVMKALLQQKYADPTYGGLLLSTGDAHLREGNTWGDVFWGQVQRNGVWVGENHLGQLLMQIREDLYKKYTGACLDR